MAKEMVGKAYDVIRNATMIYYSDGTFDAEPGDTTRNDRVDIDSIIDSIVVTAEDGETTATVGEIRAGLEAFNKLPAEEQETLVNTTTQKEDFVAPTFNEETPDVVLEIKSE